MKPKTKIGKELVLEIILFLCMIVLASIFYKNNLLLAFLLVLIWAIGIIFWHTKEDLLFFIGGATVPLIGELVCVYVGVWQYANPTFLGIPLWLPFGWGLTSVLIKRIAETIVKLEK